MPAPQQLLEAQAEFPAGGAVGIHADEVDDRAVGIPDRLDHRSGVHHRVDLGAQQGADLFAVLQCDCQPGLGAVALEEAAELGARPATSDPTSNGVLNAARRPERRAASRHGKVSQLAMSSSQICVPDSQTRPGSPSPMPKA